MAKTTTQIVTVNRDALRRDGSLYINVTDDTGKIVAVTRFSVLHKEIEVRTATPNGNTIQRVEVAQ